jgi:hypothetical protein
MPSPFQKGLDAATKGKPMPNVSKVPPPVKDQIQRGFKTGQPITKKK